MKDQIAENVSRFCEARSNTLLSYFSVSSAHFKDEWTSRFKKKVDVTFLKFRKLELSKKNCSRSGKTLGQESELDISKRKKKHIFRLRLSIC